MDHPSVYYDTVSEAIRKLREKGFKKDFNLEENCLVCHPEKYAPEEFDVVEIYRYEGNTDPADEATVYGIISRSGVKGILVTAYGATTDALSAEILEKLTMRN